MGSQGWGIFLLIFVIVFVFVFVFVIAIAFVFADILGEETTRSWEEKLCTRRWMLFLLSDKGVNLFSFEFQEAGMCYRMQELVEEIYAGRGEDLRKVPHRLAALKIYERSSKC